jgi:hypothetical protein
MHVVTHDDVMNSEDGDVMLKYIVSQECEEQVITNVWSVR